MRLWRVAIALPKAKPKAPIEDAGYTNVSELKKDDNGVWRGKASKGGSQLSKHRFPRQRQPSEVTQG